MAFEYPTLLPQLGEKSKLGIASRVSPFLAKAIHWIDKQIHPMVTSVQNLYLEAFRKEQKARSDADKLFVHSGRATDEAKNDYTDYRMVAWRVLGAIASGVLLALLGAPVGALFSFDPVGLAIGAGAGFVVGACAGYHSPEFGFACFRALGILLALPFILPFTLALDAISGLTGGWLANLFKPKMKLNYEPVSTAEIAPLASALQSPFFLIQSALQSQPAMENLLVASLSDIPEKIDETARSQVQSFHQALEQGGLLTFNQEQQGPRFFRVIDNKVVAVADPDDQASAVSIPDCMLQQN